MKNILLSIGFGLLILANATVWSEVLGSKTFEVSFLDIGQGDAIFLETPSAQQILIDGGPDNTILERLALRMLPWDKTINLVILTHPDKDHVAGLIEVLKLYSVKKILWTGVQKDTGEYEEWVRLLKEEGAEITVALPPQRIYLDSGFIDVLHPRDIEGRSINDTSMVLRLVVGDSSFLFTGDIGIKVERELVESGVNIKADVLKVSHHGSKTSTSSFFLEAVQPSVAVISLGENTFGHPHPLTLASLAQYGINVMRTDEEGDITFSIQQ
ncbi:MAG: MBL fold metallo-hydrolase [Patescibacteria group bacterium]|nr:MBL fold metallo-hydrolase [Patescibacteria group bacterium]